VQNQALRFSYNKKVRILKDKNVKKHYKKH
jgi:hypothetical protein